MHVLVSLLLILICSRILGELVLRFGQPRIIGEIFAGIVLGPLVLDLVHINDQIAGISELSVFLIVLSAGLEMDFGDVVSSFRGRAIICSALSFLLPCIAGFVVGVVFGFDLLRSLFLGLCMSVTALPVAVRILANFNMLKSSIARYAITAAIMNDILALLLVGILIQLDQVANASVTIVVPKLVSSALKILVFALVVAAVHKLISSGKPKGIVVRQLIERLVGKFGHEALFGAAVLFVLIIGTISDSLGTHLVIGTFFGALLLSKDLFGEHSFNDLQQNLNAMTGGFLAPIFFAFLGLSIEAEGLLTNISLVASVLFVAIIAKVLAGYIGGRFLKMSHRESLGLGVILNGRGIMELVVANIAMQAGFIDQKLFSILVLMGVVTTMITPPLFKRLLVKDQSRGTLQSGNVYAKTVPQG